MDNSSELIPDFVSLNKERKPAMKNCMKLLILLALLTMSARQLQAQSLFASLTGVVSDPSGAVVTKATVRLINEQSGSARETVTNADGYYSFASLAVGDFKYKLVVEAQGFATYQAPGMTILGGEKRNVDMRSSRHHRRDSRSHRCRRPSCRSTPVRSLKLTTKELQNFVQTGSNAAEFIKIMPGFGISNGTSNKSNYGGETIGINGNGDAGSQSPLNGAYSYNGLPNNSLDITADGAHVSDPGCNCDTPVNPEFGHDLRVPGEDVELQRRESEGTGGHHFGGEIRRQGLPWVGVPVCPKLRDERQ